MHAIWKRNLEHGGIQYESDAKPSQEVIDSLKAQGFRWSRHQSLWYAKETPSRVVFLDSIATYEGQIGAPLSFAEQMDRKLERASSRAERLDELAKKTTQQAEALHTQAERMANIIPFGQPILVGHHSECADRRYRSKIQNMYHKAFGAQKDAEEIANKANIASSFEERTFDPGKVLRRIAKLEAEARRYQADGRDTKQYEEEISYWKSQVAQRGFKVWGPSDFQVGDRVMIRGDKATIKKVNQKTIIVKYDLEWINKLNVTKVPYNELAQGCKQVAQNVAHHDS